MSMMRAIICRFQVEGVHHRQTTQESHQYGLHRHMFHFIVTLNAADAELELDAIRVRRMCLQQFDEFGGATTLMNFDDRQAIDIADLLARALWDAFGQRGVRVEVLEDGENGAVVTYGM